MGTIKGFVLDSTLRSMARNIIELKKTGVACDVDQTVANWNEKYRMVESTSQLQNDVKLFIDLEENRQVTSMSAKGYSAYKAEPYVEKAKELMSENYEPKLS